MEKENKVTYRQKIGKWGESQAEKYLIQKGLTVIDKNFRRHHGEIDLICLENENVVFVEVKTRTNENSGFPEDAVTEKKQKNISLVAEIFMEENPNFKKSRFDVIAISGNPKSKNISINWFKDVI